MSIDLVQETRAEAQAHFTQAHIDIAVLKVMVQSQAREIDALTQAVKAMAEQIGTMNSLLSEAKGGWKIIAAVAGAAGVFGSAISWVLIHVPILQKGP